MSQQIQNEIESLSDRIPVVVRAIWGRHSEAVVDALKQHKQLAAKLIHQWEVAEHRLIAVANSLSASSSGQVSPALYWFVMLLVVLASRPAITQ